MPPTFLEIAVVTLENNAAQKKFSLSCPHQIQFPSYGSGEEELIDEHLELTERC